jgi:hypothetical protein
MMFAVKARLAKDFRTGASPVPNNIAVNPETLLFVPGPDDEQQAPTQPEPAPVKKAPVQPEPALVKKAPVQQLPARKTGLVRQIKQLFRRRSA